MKGAIYVMTCLTVLMQSCTGQTSQKKEIYNRDFNWTIKIPENFETVSAEQWAQMQNKGADAIEQTYNEKVENKAKTIFVFKSDQLNYFESNYQPFDPAVDGDYLASCKNVNDVLYQTFMTQMPDGKIDTTTGSETIDNLVFQTFKMKITYPNEMILNVLVFSRLFDKKEFSVNIMYVDKHKGELMLDSWKTSRFSKK